MLGIGGGGDVIGSLAVARRCEELGTDFVLGGVAWERFARDPRPGPRPLDEVRDGRRIGEHAMLAGPGTATDDGVLFSEAFAARHLRAAGREAAEVALIDATAGAPGAARGIEAVAAELDCDLVIHVDIGGDAIAAGHEPGLSSPLCDAIMLAAALRLEPDLAQAGVILGTGCDGELTPPEVMARVAALAREAAWTSAWSVSSRIADEIAASAEGSGTEASALVARAARGEHGDVEIRGGRRTVALGPVAAIAFCFDPAAGAAEIPLARAVSDAATVETARDVLAGLGLRTELDWERDRAEASAYGNG